MTPIIQLLNEMRGRLPMYVGANSIAKLAMFLRGYSYALRQHGLDEGDAFLSEFQAMVATRFDVKITRSWENIILFQAVDDQEAVALFWELFDEYCAHRKQQE